MRGYERLSDREIERLYNAAVELVESWKDQSNPDIRLAPMGEREIGEEALKSEIQGVRGGIDFVAKGKELERTLPDATIKMEPQPNGKARFWVVIPIWEAVVHHAKNEDLHHEKAPGRPSDTYLMFLVMVEVFLGTVLYFRMQ